MTYTLKQVEQALNLTFDDWQRDFITHQGNVHARCGRQSGKSFSESARIGLFMLNNPNTQTLIIGAVERQATELLEKVRFFVSAVSKYSISEKPTIHKLELDNGSKCIALASGRTGYGLRNYTIHKLVADEAAYIPQEVWSAVLPMLATTKGTIDLLSTPRGAIGFFFTATQDPTFKCFHVSSEDCPRIPKEFLAQERKRLSKVVYAQEYLAEFTTSLSQFFSREIVDACCVLPVLAEPKAEPSQSYYLGVDVARYGGDENAFAMLLYRSRTSLEHVYNHTTTNVSTMRTIEKVKQLFSRWNPRKVYIDDGGIGGAVLDNLLEQPTISRHVVGINNASKSIDSSKKRNKRILKEDLYGNFLRMMEQGEIKLLDDENVRMSLLSIQYEYTDAGNLNFFSHYSHIVEALIRAAWCVKDKGLKPWIY